MSRVTTLSIRNSKVVEGMSPLVAVTAYDYTFAKLVDDLVDIVLVGDSVGMVVQGHSNTLSVRLEDMIYHSRCVSKGLQKAHLVVDMPFMSYQVNIEDALKNAGRLLSEGEAHAVKIEGGVAVAKTITKMVEVGIPVMGHIGLTPQSVHALGGYRVQGKTASARESIIQDAIALEDAGVYAMVLEGIPVELAKAITERVKVPTIGIGAGPNCDGQILVLQDFLGLNTDFHPKFVKRFAQLAEETRKAVGAYASEVRQKNFPEREHSFHVDS
ncbi:MAG: 3-methyl-2-oxobutanoate hydroxymethyltransferase [Proteobacteria bacterium]|nr:3-methyl-2-oxobutanoate hydroxymethyltransferase [Pseudomonadota bacterium]NBY19593.1 3-methyl-2-oxobutanoate hydroxymethyltransferase [bacterium]